MDLPALYRLLRARLAAAPAAARFMVGIPQVPGPERGLAPADAPGRASLARAVPGPGEAALLAACRAVADRLAWRQSYTAAEIGESYLAGSGYVEMTGRRGHFGAAGTAFGLGVIGAHADYPEHRHPAAEVYLLVAGHAEWSVEGGPWVRAGAGGAVATAPHAWHAIRTGEAVAVYLYAWAGGDPAVRSELRGDRR